MKQKKPVGAIIALLAALGKRAPKEKMKTAAVILFFVFAIFADIPAADGWLQNDPHPAVSTPLGNQDSALKRLLDMSVFPTTGPQGLAYARELEKALLQNPVPALKPEAFRRIGDIYYSEKRLSDMSKWYRMLLAIDPSLNATTPIGFRLGEYAHHVLRRNILFAVFFTYGVIIMLLFLRSFFAKGTFRPLYFLKRCVIYLVIFCALCIVVFALDAKWSSKAALSMTNSEAIRLATPKPIVPLSIIDSSAPLRAGVVIFLGFLPVFLVIVYTSYKRPYSRWVISGLILLTAASTWTHFLIITTFDDLLAPKAVIQKTRVWFKGEPEDLLLKDPGKVLRANPDFLKSDNDDLEEFLEKHYPNGLPLRKQ